MNTYQEMLKDIKFRTQAYINGQFVDASTKQTFTTLNPATGEEIARIADCSEVEVNAAVKAARDSFESGVWSEMAPSERKKVLQKFADLVEEHATEIAILDALEAGKPIDALLNVELPDTVETIRWYAEAIDKVSDKVTATDSDTVSLVVKEPIGVVGSVLPWNFPALLVGWKIAPALAAGCSVVMKPAELTNLSSLRMVELATEAGVPAGVFNVVTGFGPTVGEPIGRHPDIDVVSFTGSTEVGRYFLKYSSDSNLKRVVLELGGKSPQVVMPDADLDSVMGDIMDAAFFNMGENCSCGSRLLVHKDIKDDVLSRIVSLLDEQKIGNPFDPNTTMGSMIESDHLDTVLSYIEAGKNEGAEIVYGGKQVLIESGGSFVEPTVFDNVTNDMKIAQEEIFGPVLSIITFSDIDEAISIANDTDYGLAASVYTTDIKTAHKLSRKIKAGTVSVNCFSEGDITAPFGGYKMSGFGGKDKGIEALDQYFEIKTIWYSN